MHVRTLKADLMLLAVAVMWGAGFTSQRSAMESMGPFTFNAARYAVGAAVILPLILFRKSRPRPDRRTLIVGVLLGVVMWGASGFQQMGLVTTTASRAGFITGLYVLGVPLLGLLLGHRLSKGHLLGAVLAAAGLAMLCGNLSGGNIRGDLLVLGCAVLWAVHVVLVALIAGDGDALVLACTQFIVVAILSLIVAHVVETPTLVGLRVGAIPLLYNGVFAIAIAFTLQIIAQRDAPPTHAAVLMSLEAVFGALFGVLLLSERLSAAEWAGCGLMFAGMLACQLWPHTRTPEEQAQLTDPVR
ncbi:MAG TPA: DMT family transporter [Phycisphaerales bacterium]|nr:DMT family transporter [Phycisphaerales bacterium]